MALNNLQEFITFLESRGELARISAVTDPILEIAAITDRVCKKPLGGKALIFERIAHSNFKIATNLFGSKRRVCMALGVDRLSRLTERLSAILDRIPAVGLDGLDYRISDLPEFSYFRPHIKAESEPDMTTMGAPDLTAFPFLQSWPEDGSASGHARYITLPQVFTVDPDNGTPNCGLYRLQVRGPAELGIQWKTGSGADRHAELFRKQGRSMPVAIVLGGDPAMLFSAMFPLPGALDEVTFAGFLRGSPLEITPCQSVPLSVPTGSEVVIEGYVHPGEFVLEGPYGNHSGFYSPAVPAAKLRVTAIRHSRNAIIPATVVGPPPMEDCWMAKAWEHLLLAFIRKLAPSVKEICFPFEWIFHQSAVISLENPRPGMVSDISGLLWALPWFAVSRILIFVDAEAGHPTLPHTAWKCINLVNDACNITNDKATQRIAVDATGSTAARNTAKMSEAVIRQIDLRWQEYNLE